MTISMKIAAGFAAVALLAPGGPQGPLISTTIVFPKLGAVVDKALARKGDFPRIQFTSAESKNILLDGELSDAEDWQSYGGSNGKEPEDVMVRFVVLHLSGLPDPLVVALARYPGGSDCRYVSALFGETDSKISQLTPALPDQWTRGQIGLSDPSSDGRITLTITSERYQQHDVHYMGPSRMAVFAYAYDPAQGKFIETRHTEIDTDDLKASGEDLRALFGDLFNC